MTARPHLLVCLLCVSALGAQQDAVKAIRRAFRPADDVIVAEAERLAAVDSAKGKEGSPKLVEVLLEAWMRCHAEALPVEQTMGKRISSGGAKLAARSRGEFDALLRPMMRIEEVLRSFQDRASVDRLVEAAVLGKSLDPRLRTRLCDRLGRASPELRSRVAKELPRARRPDDAWVMIRALEGLEEFPVDVVAELEARCDDPSELVRLAAVRAVGGSGVRASAGSLIERLDRSEGRMRRAVRAALIELTGRDLGPVSQSWQRWWDAEGEAFVAGRAAAPKTKGGDDAGATSSGFFGIPQDGRSILYVLDRSLSMQVAMSRQKGKAGAGEESRWDRLVTELRAALDRLDPGQAFNIVAFGDHNLMWAEGMQEASARNVGDAKRWIGGLKLELGTHVFGAFDEAFDLVGPRLSDRYFDPAVDTMLFLSDGLPTVRNPGQPNKLGRDDAELVLALVRRRNPFGSVTLHTIALGQGSRSKFLEQLAEQNGGLFVHAK